MAKTKTKTPPKAELTKPQQFYIKGNMEILTPIQIAADLGLSLEDVEAYIEEKSRDPRRSRANKLMQRPARGVVALTEAASMAMDDFSKRGGSVTQDVINRAAANGDYELAARLSEMREQECLSREQAERAKNSDRWHYITPPEELDTERQDRSRRVRK